jgi:hypothetical protein
LRLIAERAGIQTIVMDNEGEFANLREAVPIGVKALLHRPNVRRR